MMAGSAQRAALQSSPAAPLSHLLGLRQLARLLKQLRMRKVEHEAVGQSLHGQVTGMRDWHDLQGDLLHSCSHVPFRLRDARSIASQ
jgi:hypothetical protein